jgi:hypothetical protein
VSWKSAKCRNTKNDESSFLFSFHGGIVSTVPLTSAGTTAELRIDAGTAKYWVSVSMLLGWLVE